MSRIIHFLSNTIEVFESIIYFSRQVIRVFHVNARILPWFFSNFGLPIPYHSVAHHPQCQFCQQGNPKYACWGTQQEQQSVQQQQHRHREHGRARRYYGQTFTSVYCRNDVSQSIDSEKRWMLEQSKSTWTWPQRVHSPWRRRRRHIRPRRARWGVGLRRLFYVRKPWSVESPLCCCVCSVYSCLCVSVLCCVLSWFSKQWFNNRFGSSTVLERTQEESSTPTVSQKPRATFVASTNPRQHRFVGRAVPVGQPPIHEDSHGNRTCRGHWL